MASWQSYIEATMKLGFCKVTIINRNNYQPLAYSSVTDIATAWQRRDDNDKWMTVNENQELLDDWADPKRKSFCFYGQCFNVIKRSTDYDLYHQQPRTAEELFELKMLFLSGYTIRLKYYIPTVIQQLICDYMPELPFIQYRSRGECKYLVATLRKQVVIAYQFQSIWLIAYCRVKKKGRSRWQDPCVCRYDGPCPYRKYWIADARQAWNRISMGVFDAMIKDGI